MAHDALVLQQAVNVGLGERGNPIEIEVMKGCAKALTLGKDGAPSQARDGDAGLAGAKIVTIARQAERSAEQPEPAAS